MMRQAGHSLARFVGTLGAVATLIAVSAFAPAHATNVERIVSPGGIEAWLVRDTTNPMMAINFAFAGGSSQDPDAKQGLANMTAALLDEGAGELDAAAFAQQMESQAIEIRFSADRDQFRGSLRTLTERRESAFELMRLALTAPRFDSEAIERIRRQISAQLQRETTDPNTMTSLSWWATAFPGHPYGRPVKGSKTTLDAITADDLKGYVRRVLARDRLKIAIVGDIDAATAGVMLDRIFGALPAKGDLAPVATAQAAGSGRRMVVPFDSPQAVIYFGGNGLPRKHPDYMTAYVVNHVLGGGSFTSRLYQEVREKRGLTYGVYTSLYPLQFTSLLFGSMQVRADRVAEAIDVVQQEYQRMAESGPTADELEKAKDYIIGSYALQFDSSAKIAAQLVQIQIEDLGIDYITKRNAQIGAVTLEDAKRVAKSLLSSGYLTTIVGRPVGVTSSGG